MSYWSSLQKTSRPFIYRQSRAARDVETQDYAGGSISLINLSGNHRGDYTGQGNTVRRRETAMAITGQQIYSVAAARRCDDVHLAVAIEIYRSEEVRPFRQFHVTGVREERIGKLLAPDAAQNRRVFGSIRCGIAALNRYQAAARCCISADEIGEPIGVEIIRSQRQGPRPVQRTSRGFGLRSAIFPRGRVSIVGTHTSAGLQLDPRLVKILRARRNRALLRCL